MKKLLYVLLVLGVGVFLFNNLKNHPDKKINTLSKVQKQQEQQETWKKSKENKENKENKDTLDIDDDVSQLETLVIPTRQDRTDLMNLVATKNYNEVLILLENGALNGTLVNQTDAYGSTALMDALMNPDLKMIELLLKYKADPNHHDNGGNTPIGLAIGEGNPTILKMILAAGGDPNKVTNKEGFTHLMDVASEGLDEMIQLLLDSDANINARTENNETALHFAARSGFTTTVELLLKNGCDKNIKNNEGESAFDLANKYNFREVMDILK